MRDNSKLILIIIFILLVLGVLIYGYFSITGNATNNAINPFFRSSCIDSDNTIVQKNDSSYFIKGFVTYRGFIGRNYKISDICKKNDLIEAYYNIRKVPSKTLIKCKNGCLNGACLPEITNGTVQIINGCYLLNSDLLSNELFKNGKDKG